MIRIALASLKRPKTVAHGVERIAAVLAHCQGRQVELACFPETYLPGLRGGDESLPPVDQVAMEEAVREIRARCREREVAAIVGVEWMSPLGLENRVLVVSHTGRVLGHQTKNQITPGGESEHYVPDGQRRVFRIKGVPFGIVICHEGWRYPETVRWAVVRGARIIFQPQVTGSDRRPETTTSSSSLSHDAKQWRKHPRKWGDSFYEKAMVCRAQENSVFFASVNRAMVCQNSATSLIDPRGRLLAHIPYGKEDLLVADIDPESATRLYAKRLRPELYPE